MVQQWICNVAPLLFSLSFGPFSQFLFHIHTCIADWRLMTMGCGLVKERGGGEGRQMGTGAWGGLLLLGCAGLERDTNHTALFIYRLHPGHTTLPVCPFCILSFLICTCAVVSFAAIYNSTAKNQKQKKSTQEFYCFQLQFNCIFLCLQ